MRELVRSLADWAEAHKALNAVIQLPLNQLEEQVSTGTATVRYSSAHGNALCTAVPCILHPVHTLSHQGALLFA